MKKITKIISGIVGSIILCTSMTAIAGCGNRGEEEIDKTKTQLYVYNCNAGFGSESIKAIKLAFEELHKDDVYEEGKKGVQIYVSNRRDDMNTLSETLLDNREEVYFPDKTDYYTLYNKGIFADITEALTTPIDGETRTILDKMTPEQVDYFGMEGADGKTHYYGIPYNEGFSGLIYNVDVFDDWGYWFSSVVDEEDISQYNKEDLFTKTGKKSKGPDGKSGTSDDGLPATYEQFFVLCDMIAQDGNVPVTWTGKNYVDYLNYLIQALASDYEGLEQSMLNYTLTGKAENLIARFENNTPVIEEKDITPENAWQLYAQAGKYYAIDFVKKLVTTDKYHNKLAFNTTETQIAAQEDFLWAGYDGSADCAMLCDGTWWETEARQVFADMEVNVGSSVSKYNRRFAWMPLPKATAEKVKEAAAADKPYTAYDEMYSCVFVKKNIADWKLPLAIEFLKFACSDKMLQETTIITNTIPSLSFPMSNEQLNQLTYYGRSLFEFKNNADVIHPVSKTPLYLNHQQEFVSYQVFRSRINNVDYRWAAEALRKPEISSITYFNGMSTYYKNLWTVNWGV